MTKTFTEEMHQFWSDIEKEHECNCACFKKGKAQAKKEFVGWLKACYNNGENGFTYDFSKSLQSKIKELEEAK
ncbi:hypothetical protein M0R04_14710 [Candidatus Dojkabacteria bacterium]|jgi:hypothetical protein|nr:hypothetical protein [Candidatus Dojkabacteria bacterium]